MGDLKSGLLVSADLWTSAHGDAPASRLGKAVAGDANFFTRIAAPAASLTLATLEKFAAYLGDTANWPGTIPAEVVIFVQRVKGEVGHGPAIAASQHEQSTGLSAELSGAIADQGAA